MKQVRMHVIFKEHPWQEIYYRRKDNTFTNVIMMNGFVDHIVFHPYGGDDDEGDPGAFHNKSCFLEITAPLDEEWLHKVAELVSVEKNELCGALRTSEHLSDNPAIEIRINVSSEMLSQIKEALHTNQIRGRTALRLILSGEFVPDSDDLLSSLRGVDDLDITEENNYAVLGFDIMCQTAES